MSPVTIYARYGYVPGIDMCPVPMYSRYRYMAGTDIFPVTTYGYMPGIYRVMPGVVYLMDMIGHVHGCRSRNLHAQEISR